MRVLLFSACLFFLLWGCKKNEDSKTCFMNQMQVYTNGTLTYTTNYEHDDQGRIKKIMSNGTTWSYEYFPDSIVISTAFERTTYLLSNGGLVVSGKNIFLQNNAADLRLDYTYSYDAEGYLIQQREIFSQVYNGNILRDTGFFNYTVLNGNVTKLSSTQSQSTEEYYYEYSSLPLQENNPGLNPFPSGTGGFFGKPPRNLVSGLKDKNGNNAMTVSYIFSGPGRRVSEVIYKVPGSPVPATKFSLYYQCN